MKHMKLFEIGTIALFCASCLRTCNRFDEISMEDIQIECFSTCFEDKTISIVRTRRVYSVDPWEWENPVPSDDRLLECGEWMSMSNRYAIVVNDSRANKFVFDRGSAECYCYNRDMTRVGTNCVYNARNNTFEPSVSSGLCSLVQTNDCGSIVSGVVDLDGIFGRHKSCPCIFFGNGKNGVLFWRRRIDRHWRERFMRLLRAGRPYDYYTVKKFKAWDDFLAWDGVLQTKDGK